MIDHTHDVGASSWVPGANEHPDFPVQNLPLGVFSVGGGERRIGTAIGEHVLDLTELAPKLPMPVRAALAEPTLNALFALPGTDRLALRQAVFALLTSEGMQHRIMPFLKPLADCTLHLPFRIGDYTDFYVGIHHATAIGKLFRPDNALLPNYKHAPIGYHGRASSVRVSGTPVVRPRGQIKAPEADAPAHAPARRLDCELELGVWIAGDNDLGTTIPVDLAWDRIGGLTLLNDWSARDIQAWEYQPLGPFLAKNFLTTISPWVVTTEALAPFRVAQAPRPDGDPAPLPYLQSADDQTEGALSIDLGITLSTAAMRDKGLAPQRLAQGNSADAMYWTMAQIVTHHAAGGCDLHAGDLLGTGTLSGPAKGSEGSLIELTEGGRRPLVLAGGETRTFLEDGDELALVAHARREGYRSIGFGPCVGRVVPAA
ncbi:fumarylacetoacetase [Novosphingobium sp. FKTRR1]|uniref:fumarylacetoacetase n=1 Tax=Novosphingobium sp. FKTRR1 TaxID=2879118 RepID=UPI001CF02252